MGELQKLNISKNFNVFHANVNGLENKVNSLHKFLSSTEVYICGDFNIDLSKIETLNSNQEYCNLLCSYGFLPQIIQPTRVVANQSPSLVDNIFTNNINDEITSGNIFLTFSAHFSQIVTVKREKMDYKAQKIYIRDYSKFSSESFRDDISI